MQKNAEKFLDVDLILNKASVMEKSKIADLGCGATGCFIFPAAEKTGYQGRVYAVDVLKNALETINHRVRQDNVQNIKTVWSDLEVFKATRINTGSLDAVLLVNTLYQSKKRAEVMREAIRLLKKGGRLVVVEWKSMAIPFGPPPEERVQVELLKKGGLKLGLKLDDEFSAGQFHYGLVFSKL